MRVVPGHLPMRPACLLAIALALAGPTAAAAQPPALRVTAPTADTAVFGPTRLEAVVTPAEAAGRVETITFFVNGRLACTVERPPFGCSWDAGALGRGHHVRVVARLADGGRLVANVRTKELGYTERVRADAVLVPTIVRDDGQFVRGLKRQDFEVFEDGVRQPLGSVISEEAPLDLVLAVDISGSMEDALPDVKEAVRTLLARLRPGDAATILGFNDNTFLVAERETDPAARERAVALLTSWGGTSLYDATARALDLVSREWGRKGVVIFSDGDDQNSLTGRETALARVQASDAMIYTVGFGSGGTVPQLRASLETYARATGGRAFFPRSRADLDRAFDEVVTELANQYVLSYSPLRTQDDGTWRSIEVQVRKGKYEVRARQGYRAVGEQPGR